MTSLDDKVLSIETKNVKETGPGIELVSQRSYYGSNIYHSKTVVRLRIALIEPAKVEAAVRNPAFIEALRERFGALPFLVADPLLKEAVRPSLPRAEEENYAAKLLLWSILSVELAARASAHRLEPIHFSQFVRTSRPDRLFVVWSSSVPWLSIDCGKAAVVGFDELIERTRNPDQHHNQAGRFEIAYRELREHALANCFSPTVAMIAEAARANDIPYRYEGNSTLSLGQGRWQRRLYGSISSLTSLSAAELCQCKETTIKRLRDYRLPVPRQTRASSIDDVLRISGRIGFPVVVKPLRGAQGYGVTTGIKNRTELETAYRSASEFSREVVVESHIRGEDFRLLVIGNKFVAGLTRAVPTVVGDGIRTIDELIDELNSDPYRNGFLLYQLERDDDLIDILKRAKCDLSSVLKAGQTLPLRTVANVSQGGMSVDVTELVHPDNREMAEQAAAAVKLDVAGIDFMTTDISRSYREIGGGIIEINARPGLCMHTWPRKGKPRQVAKQMLKLMYPEENSARVPAIVIVGHGGTAVIARELHDSIQGQVGTIGTKIRSNAFVDGRVAEFSERQTPNALALLLRDPELDLLIRTASPFEIVDEGLELDKTHIAVFVKPKKHYDREEYMQAIRVVLRSNPDAVLFDADVDDVALKATAEIEPEKVIYIAQSGLTSLVCQHLASGGRAIVSENINEADCISHYSPGGRKDRATLRDDMRCSLRSRAARGQILPGRRSNTPEVWMFASAIAKELKTIRHQKMIPSRIAGMEVK